MMKQLVLWVWLLQLVVITRGGNSNNVKDDLYQASYIGDVSRVEYLLGLDPDILSSRAPVLVNRRSEPYGRTPAMVCGFDPQKNQTDIDVDCTKIVKMIHQHGGNLDATDKAGWDALSLAAFRGMTKLSRYILKESEVPVNRVDNEGRSPLMKAAANGYNETYRLLVKYGGDLQQQDHQGRCSLHYITLFAIKDHESGLPFLRQALILHKTENVLDLVDKDGRNILMYASIANDVQVTEIILQHLDQRVSASDEVALEGQIDRRDDFEMTAMMMSSSHRLKTLLANWKADLVLKKHQAWIEQQQGLLQPENSLVDTRDDTFDNQHVLIQSTQEKSEL